MPGAGPCSRLWRSQLGRFLLVGAVNTAFGYGFFALLIWLGLVDALAALGASLAGPLFNFVTTGKFVFGQLQSRRLPRFLGAYAILYVLAVIELRVGRVLGWSPYFTGAAITLPNALIGYAIMKTVVFAPKAHAAQKQQRGDA